MAADLKGRVPVEGMRDCELGRAERVLRTRLRRWEREREGSGKGWVGLREVWERGQKARDEVGEEKGGG